MIVAAVAIPLVGGCAALLSRRLAPFVAILTGIAAASTALRIAATVGRDGITVTEIGGWAAPLGIVLAADGFTVVMLLMTASVLLPVLLYTCAYSRTSHVTWHPPDVPWALIVLLWGAMNALFLSRDIFNLYVSLELLTLIAVVLVVLEGEEAALLGAMRYLFAGFLASVFYLFGVAILYARYERLDLEGLGAVVTADPATLLAAALITGSLATKSALFPLHFWLARAHAAAPAPISAILSSLVVTAAYYLFIRMWSVVFASVATPLLGTAIGLLGAAAIVWGSLQAIRQQHLKVMIAYSTVAQIGYLFLPVPIIMAALASPVPIPWGALAWDGAIYQAVSHALAKAAMFLAAGSIVMAVGDDRIVGISGIASHLPITTYAFGIAGMTLIGLPPSGGFVAKWMMLTAAFQSGQWWWAVVMLVGGILTAGYVFIVLSQEFSHAGGDQEIELRPVPLVMEITAMVLAVAALMLGLRISEPLQIIEIGLPIGGR